jgi:hypothetical protein
MKKLLPTAAALCMSCSALAQEPAEEPAAEPAEAAAEQQARAEKTGDGISQPKTMSGMSVLGNEEAPKSLVIVPWKSSELGDNISLSDTLDDRARPVDKEVFLRELHFYEIRAGKVSDQG